ncbi:hypothetical protein BFG60_0908 [Microcystis aeruginosa NIES-98]|nr:hypothetical protein BFG60_0908 [Microcystis aeruginosa NIES-98]
MGNGPLYPPHTPHPTPHTPHPTPHFPLPLLPLRKKNATIKLNRASTLVTAFQVF